MISSFRQSFDRRQRPLENKPIDEVGFSDDWANNSISNFLESAMAWADSSGFGISQDSGLKINKWKQFWVFLHCGKIYE